MFDDLPRWALVLGGVTFGAILFYLAWRFFRKEKESKTQKTPEKPKEAETFSPGKPSEAVSEKTLVLLRWNKCGHCKTFMPTWEKIKNELSNFINFEEHEAEAEPDYMKKVGINSFPTILLMHQNGSTQKYEGDRSLESIIKFCGFQKSADSKN
jgi:glutaredoxin